MQKWNDLNTISQLEEIKSGSGYAAIFKHSTRCSISLMAKKAFEADWTAIPADVNLYFLDLIKHRDVSAAIAELFKVHHESPQILLIKGGECILFKCSLS